MKIASFFKVVPSVHFRTTYSFIKQTKCINQVNIKIKDAIPTRVGETIKSSEIACAKFKVSYKC